MPCGRTELVRTRRRLPRFQGAQTAFLSLEVAGQLALEGRVGGGGQKGAGVSDGLTARGDQARPLIALGGHRGSPLGRRSLFFLGGLQRGGLPGGGRVAQGVLDRIAALEVAGTQQGRADDDEGEGAKAHQLSIQFGIQPSWISRRWATGMR